MDSFRIEFELRALAEIEPWVSPDSGPLLHWFGLTDGRYDVVISEQRLFGDVEYQVVRLWEDLIDVVPAVLEEVPGALAMRAASGDLWDRWVENARGADVSDELREVALSWWVDRLVGTSHLQGAPHLYLWSRGDEVHLRWRSPRRRPEDPEWPSPRGDAIVTIGSFVDELVRFDRALIDAMQSRIAAIASGWTRPEVTIDLAKLRREHQDRATWLARTLTMKRAAKHEWNEVLAATATLEDRIGPVLDAR